MYFWMLPLKICTTSFSASKWKAGFINRRCLCHVSPSTNTRLWLPNHDWEMGSLSAFSLKALTKRLVLFRKNLLALGSQIEMRCLPSQMQ
jgi:hypothetical protein